MIVFLRPAENDKNFERAIRKYYSLRNDGFGANGEGESVTVSG